MIILDKLEQEYLLRTLESGVALTERHQLFLWTQGPFQALLPHDIMLCVQLGAAGNVERVECLHRTVLDAAALTRLRCEVAPALVARWQAGEAVPLGFDFGDGAAGVENALVHGSAQSGSAATVFALLGMPARAGGRHAYFLQLLLPYLHLALLRIRPGGGAGQGADGTLARALSGRELAVLDGVRAGRSNEEVAHQLGISALTVKNHLQRSYRVLGVANRAHAVARCLALRLL